MDSDASDNYENLYDEEDAPKHDKLVEKVLRLNKIQHLKKPSRTEPTLQISEFDLVKSITGEKGSIQISDLTQSLKNRKSRIKISENVRKVQRGSHTLPKPLEKPQANRIRRSVAYEKARLQLDRWEPTVTANRVSVNLSFPLDNDLKMDKKEATNVAGMWRVKSKLEEELEKHEPQVEEFKIDLEEEKFPLTMKEMLTRRKEAAKLRAFQGYQEAKARRQNKIKSKKYHRIQKREKIKRKLKEFEKLQKTNPEEALKKLEEIEKCRIEERFSLRHKSTGKWARNQQIRAKYDKESREVLAEQLKLSRDITQKVRDPGSDSEEEQEETEKNLGQVNKENPWINGIKPGDEVANFISGYRKYWMAKNQTQEETVEAQEKEDVLEEVEMNEEIVEGREENVIQNGGVKECNKIEGEEELVKESTEKVARKKRKQLKGKVTAELDRSQSTSEWEVSNLGEIEDMFSQLENKLEKNMLRNVKKLKSKLNEKQQSIRKKAKEKQKVDLSLPLQKKVPIIDQELQQNPNKDPENGVSHGESLSALKNILSSETKEPNVDPDKFLKVKPTNLSTAIPDIMTAEDDEEIVQRDIICEAFEDDDIVDDFNKEKRNEIEKDKPKDINLSLPGWGAWGGTNIKPNTRKKRRFIVKAPKKVPRRDDNKGTLIVNEKASKKIKEHQLSEVPFPFKTVKDLEGSLRAPIGNSFVPESAYKKLIRPAVTTKMGAIIEPLSRDILVNKK
ncbi:hypothetical protein MTP99_018702 [Tenebrio molitor]|nr:hypothetical protein MTP99_018702 [Tenebrio molitor]